MKYLRILLILLVNSVYNQVIGLDLGSQYFKVLLYSKH